MDELTRKMEIARRHVSAPEAFDPDHAALLRVGIERRARRRRVARAAAATTLVALAVVIGALSLEPERAEQPQPIARTAAPASSPIAPAPEPGPRTAEETGRPAPEVLRLGDGSTITPAEDAEVTIRDLTAERVTVNLAAGRTLFDVAPRPKRIFEVQTGHVRILVVGTAFTVDERADRTGVVVHRGRVRVVHAGGSQELGEGESGWYAGHLPAGPEPTSRRRTPPARRVAAKPAQRSVAKHESIESRAHPTAPVREAPDPIEIHEERAPPERPEPPAVDEAGELLRAADAARRSSRHTEAIERLEAVIAHHADDPRAPLAAFTLGRVLLDLGRAEEAAGAFARARRLDPTGTLAEDALVREADAWSDAGRADRARALAEDYLRLYPDGRREAGVRRHLE